MLFVEAFFKFGSIGLLIAVGLLLLRDGREVRALRFAIPLILAICFMFATTGSPALTITGPLVVPLRIFDSFNTVFIWWLGLALFDDDFKLGAREWLVAAAYGLIMLPVRLHYLGFDNYWHPAMDIAMSVFSFVLMVHLGYLALTGHKEDLVEKRRRIRIWFVIAVALLVIVSVLAERVAGVVGNFQQDTIWITYIFTMPLAAWALLWLTRLHPEVLAFEKQATPDLTSVDHQDQIAYQTLLALMEEQRVYTNHGLTIADLAKQVDLPAHKLRKLINQSMGFRNFSSYLNKYRLAEVKRLLADPNHARLPILSLAMESGFSSLAPFNRAFKASEGITPTQYRAQKLDNFEQKPVQN